MVDGNNYDKLGGSSLGESPGSEIGTKIVSSDVRVDRSNVGMFEEK